MVALARTHNKPARGGRRFQRGVSEMSEMSEISEMSEMSESDSESERVSE